MARLPPRISANRKISCTIAELACQGQSIIPGIYVLRDKHAPKQNTCRRAGRMIRDLICELNSSAAAKRIWKGNYGPGDHSNRLFHGAAVHWKSSGRVPAGRAARRSWMQLVAREMNLSETAFLVPRRWLRTAVVHAGNRGRSLRPCHPRERPFPVGRGSPCDRSASALSYSIRSAYGREARNLDRDRISRPRPRTGSLCRSTGISAGSESQLRRPNAFRLCGGSCSEEAVRALKPDFGALGGRKRAG